MSIYKELELAVLLKRADPPTEYPADLKQDQRKAFLAKAAAMRDAIDSTPNTEYGSRAWLAGCDEVDGDSDVSEEQDQRNSRPFPY
jgi:hypothetical protein